MLSWRRIASSRHWVAIAVAYLLVLETILAGLASGASAASFNLDRSLALTHCASSDMPPEGSYQHGNGIPDRPVCCVLGCTFGNGPSVTATSCFLPVPYRAVIQVAFAQRYDAPHVIAARRWPANPRAPPSKV